MKTIQGVPSRKFRTILGEVTFEKKPFYYRSNFILATNKFSFDCLGYKGCITSGGKGAFYYPDHIYNVNDISNLNDGDIITISDDGNIIIVWEIESRHNSLMLTEKCNCRCLMCPQPPASNNDKKLIKDTDLTLDLLKDKKISEICITGGEPTEVGDDFIRILKRCSIEHPEAYINILTNGKNFSNKEYIDKFIGLNTQNITFCVSFHSEIDSLFDKIAGSKGSFQKTQDGIYNLASLGFSIEIRTVVSKLNYKHLKSFAEHLYNYFPFCRHYAFMGMEIHGLAEKNIEVVNIFPSEYRNELKDAILTLSRRCLPVSIYNIPLCCLAEEIRPYARQSISGWKNIFLQKCEFCSKKHECSGFFSTSSILPENIINPFNEM